MIDNLVKTFSFAALTIVLTLALGWLATAANTGDGANPSWFTVVTGITSLVVFVGGCWADISIVDPAADLPCGRILVGECKMKVVVNGIKDEEEFQRLQSFHTLPRKGEHVDYLDVTWRVSAVIHYCSSPGGLIEYPQIYLEEI